MISENFEHLIELWEILSDTIHLCPFFTSEQDKLGEFPTIYHQGIFDNVHGSLENLCAFLLKLPGEKNIFPWAKTYEISLNS